MKKTSLFTGAAACAGILLLILDGKTALEGARAGMDLVLKTVIPSLFPFFFLSILLTSSLRGSTFALLRPLARLCHIPSGTEFILLSGFLGGYPSGAQAVSAAWAGGCLSKEDAQRMLAFCNNAGPSFLFGMIAPFFPEQWMVWALWGIHIAGAIAAAQLYPCTGNSGTVSSAPPKSLSMPEVLSAAISAMAAVCAWILLFRVILAFLNRWIFWFFPAELQTLLTGLLELSNGCCMLSSIADWKKRFLICSCILAMGGFCVTMQTVSVTNALSLRYYYRGKLLQTLFSAGLCCAILYHAYVPILFFIPIYLSVHQKRKKEVAFAA